jgi:ribonuclease HI
LRIQRSGLVGKDSGVPRDRVRLVTDGACSGNPGPGGWAFILTHVASGKTMECSGAELETTNNRMELMSVIEGLSTLKRPCRVELVTDSQYVARGISEWLPTWKRQGWQRKEGKRLKPISNADLWQQLDAIVSVHQVSVQHVRGHRGHAENEACDRMAVDAYKRLLNDRS